MALMTYRKYAAHRDYSLRAVQKAIADGRISEALVLEPGARFAKIDSDKADALWVRNTDETKRSLLFSPSAAAELAADDIDLNTPPPRREPPAAPSMGAAGVDTPAGGDTAKADADVDDEKREYRLQRTERERIAVELAQMDLAERKGKLIDIDDVVELVSTSLRVLRDALRNIGVRNGAMLAELKDPFECARLVDEEIDAALSSMTVDKILTPQTDEDVTDRDES